MDDNQSDIDKIKQEINRYESLFDYDGPGKMLPWKDYMGEKEKQRAETKPYFTGLAELDHFLDGFTPGEVVVITGLMGNGKTLFTRTLCYYLGKQDHHISIFSFENSPYDYLKSFDGLAHNFNFYVPRENTPGSLKWVEERIIESRIKFGTKFVVLDHLHYVVEMSSSNMSQDIGVAMRRLKILATEEQVVIFIVCHQKGLENGKVEPSLLTCRDSSSIPQECDSGVVVHRIMDRDESGEPIDSYDQGYCFVKIDKARRKGTYRKKLTFQKKGEWLEPAL